MTQQVRWDSCDGRGWRDKEATETIEKPNRDALMLQQGCQAIMALPSYSGCRRASASTGLLGITLHLLVCSLVQLPATAMQLPGTFSNVTHPSSFYNSSRTFIQRGFSGIVAAPQHSKSLPGWRVNMPSKAPQGQQEGTLHSAVTTPTSAADVSLPRHARGVPLGLRNRARRSATAMRRIELHGPPLPDARTLFVEVVVLADHSLYDHYGQHGALQRVAQILSVANKVLGDVGVVLVPTDVRVWARGDQFSVSSKMENNVDGLQQYRLSLLQHNRHLPNDHTVLVTRKQMLGQVACGAPLRGMCRQRESVGVVQDEGEAPNGAGVALAHQVGHSLGMVDDAHDADNACGCHASACVMSRHFRNASTPKLKWSSCSRESLSSVRNSLALDCLRNAPTRMYQSSSCGDGVVDEGEQCDCGPAEFCDNPCCVAATCTLAVNASCASGSCCDTRTCQPKPTGTVCRAALTDCDLPEFCSGHSEYCPVDVTLADGAPCHGGKGHCYSGTCGSRQGRCEQLQGTLTAAASPECYSELNVRGNNAGNCGFESGVYRSCQPGDSLCGTLHCLAAASPSSLLPDHRNGSRRAGPHQCHFIFASEKYPAHHWLTPDGASCGPGKMCVKQRCQEVPAPSGDCRFGCSGHGVCNVHGNCHCDAGYSPPDCSLAGLGGSVNSNVMSVPSDFRPLITSLWVLLVLLASLVVVTCCSWSYFKGWYKKKGRDHASRVLPCCVPCLDTCCCPIMTKTARWILTVRSSQENRQSKRNVEVEEGVNEQMLCSVDLDIKGTSQTNSWGVANERLVTEVVTITPKNSPDMRRKVRLPSDASDHHHKSQDNLQRPKYLQSISMDSGCVSDSSEDDSSKRSSLHLSMSSLVSVFRRIGSKNWKETTEKEKRLSRNFGSQKSIPLSRLVVDPLAGGRSSRQATPPLEGVKPAYCRSFSNDFVSGRVRKGDSPQSLPSSPLKPAKSEENVSTSSEKPCHVKLPCRQSRPPVDGPTQMSASPEDHTRTAAVRVPATTNDRKVPLLPPAKKPLPSPPKVPTSRHNASPPQVTSQRHSNGRLQGKVSPPHEACQSNLPSKTWSQTQKSSPETTTSRGNNKVMAMAKRFDAT